MPAETQFCLLPVVRLGTGSLDAQTRGEQGAIQRSLEAVERDDYLVVLFCG
jgi:hypothetical protein